MSIRLSAIDGIWLRRSLRQGGRRRNIRRFRLPRPRMHSDWLYRCPIRFVRASNLFGGENSLIALYALPVDFDAETVPDDYEPGDLIHLLLFPEQLTM